MANAIINEIDFTLFYDCDQLRDKKLSRLSDKGKIEWFAKRMEFVFLKPLTILFDKSFEEKNSKDGNGTFTIMSFSILLNGVEALGSFLVPLKDKKKNGKYTSGKNRDCFLEFIKKYMSEWNKNKIPDKLWKNFRNGIAHAFVIENGGIDYDADSVRFRTTKQGTLEIGPQAFFKDFQNGLACFFKDVGSKTDIKRVFLDNFKEYYPH